MTTLSNTYTASHAATHRAITILGAGHIGFAMALLLQQAGDYDILVVDRDPARLAEVAALGVSTQLATDDASLQTSIDGRFAVLNALPFHRAVPVATLCAAAGVHYFDLTEDVASTQAIRALAANARSAPRQARPSPSGRCASTSHSACPCSRASQVAVAMSVAASTTAGTPASASDRKSRLIGSSSTSNRRGRLAFIGRGPGERESVYA